MDYIRVKNWDEFQHYRDRSPPWIKLHNALLDDYEFARLHDASKMHLVGIWMLASRSNNRVPADPEWIAKKISATEPVDLCALIDAGFLILESDKKQSRSNSERDASAAIAQCSTDHKVTVALARSREAEGETETEAEGEEKQRNAPSAAAAASPPVAFIPLVDKSEWPVTADVVAELSRAFPAVDVPQELAKARSWSIANPKNRKTKNGVARFLHTWMERAQNSSRPKPGSPGSSRLAVRFSDSDYQGGP